MQLSQRSVGCCGQDQASCSGRQHGRAPALWSAVRAPRRHTASQAPPMQAPNALQRPQLDRPPSSAADQKLMSRPVLANVDDRKLAAARGTVLFDETHSRMAAYDGLEATWEDLGLHEQAQQHQQEVGQLWQQQEQQQEGKASWRAVAPSGMPLPGPAVLQTGQGAAAAAPAESQPAAAGSPASDAADEEESGGGAWVPAPILSFSELGGPPRLLKNMVKAHIQRPTPVQRHAIPAIRSGRDLLITSPPGSGTTTAYLLPLLQRLLRSSRPRTANRAYPLGLVLVSTREAAAAVAAEAARLAGGTHVKTVLLTGGVPMAKQKLELRGGCDLIVATPGRLQDHLASKSVSLLRLKLLVLDEADALLDYCLEGALRQVASHASMPPPGQRQTVVACAAMPREVEQRAGDYVWRPLTLSLGAPAAAGGNAAARAGAGAAAATGVAGGSGTEVAAGVTGAELAPGGGASSTGSASSSSGFVVPGVRQRVVGLAPAQKLRAVSQFVAEHEGELCLVFTNTKEAAELVHSTLVSEGHAASVLHRGATQMERDEALQCFRFGVTPILVTTGLGARGLEVPDVRHVISYDAPGDAGEYVRRVGRAGRGGAPGLATLLFTKKDAAMAGQLLEILRANGQAVPEWLRELAEDQASSTGGGGSRGGVGEGDGSNSTGSSSQAGGTSPTHRPGHIDGAGRLFRRARGAVVELGGYADRADGSNRAWRQLQRRGQQVGAGT